MTKIIFFDIDGTLCDEVKGMPESVRTAFSQCRKRGCKLVICTGRSMGTVQEEVLELGADGYITGGGCQIWYGGEMIKDAAFSPELIRSVLSWLHGKRHIGITLESESTVFMNSCAVSLLKARNREKGKKEGNEKIIYQDNIKSLDISENVIHKICLWGQRNDYKELEYLSEGKAELAQSCLWKDTVYYEVIPSDCGKGEAIRELCRYLNIPLSHTMSFGDGKNDIGMLKVTGISAAMENGDQELFPYADMICREPMKDGIYKALVQTGVITGTASGE